MFKASVAFGEIVVVTHWKNTTATGVPSRILVPLEKVGPNPFAVFGLDHSLQIQEYHLPATKAQMNNVIPKIGITIVFAMNKNRSFDT